MRLRPAGDPPIEARIVDQHHGVGPLVAEVAIGPARQRKELVQVQQHAREPHHGQRRQIGVQRAAGRGHFGPAVADALRPRAAAQLAESDWPRADRRWARRPRRRSSCASSPAAETMLLECPQSGCLRIRRRGRRILRWKRKFPGLFDRTSSNMPARAASKSPGFGETDIANAAGDRCVRCTLRKSDHRAWQRRWQVTSHAGCRAKVLGNCSAQGSRASSRDRAIPSPIAATAEFWRPVRTTSDTGRARRPITKSPRSSHMSSHSNCGNRIALPASMATITSPRDACIPAAAPRYARRLVDSPRTSQHNRP